MDITKIIAENLSRWMRETPSLDTVKKVEAKSGVGFGTVRRARNGEGNITVENLSRIAEAFKKHPADLMRADLQSYVAAKDATPPVLAEPSPVAKFPNLPMNDLMELARRMNDKGLNQLIGAARILAEQYPKADSGRGKLIRLFRDREG
jgi:transcriptional regulator with XRE-family HTH domain